MTKAQIAIIGFVGLIVLVFTLIFLGVIPGLQRPGGNMPPPPPLTVVKLWGFAGEESAWAEVAARYEASNPGIDIVYTGVEKSNYENVLIDSLAANAGPDIFLLRHDWLQKHQNKILPAPEFLITPAQIADIFPKVVGSAFVKDNQVFALPISINTLALAYNRDIFDSKQVPTIPNGWTDIKNLIPRLREIKDSRILKSAISLGGTSASVKNAPDILTLLMLQFETATKTERGDSREAKQNLLDALKYYIDFSDPNSRNYTLDEGFKNSIDAFVEGLTAMAIVTPSDIQAIKVKNQVAFSNIRMLPMPQIDPNNPVNLTSLWGLAVSNKTANNNLAWNFISFAATNQAIVTGYSTISGNAPALRASITDFTDHPSLKVFAPQTLNAAVYPGRDEDRARTIFDNMIKSALSARGDNVRLQAIVEEALAQIGALK